NEQGVIDEGLHERLRYYRIWNDTMLKQGGNGSMAWILSGIDTISGGLYEDYDRYSLYRGDETASLLGAYAERFMRAALACEAAEGPAGPPSPFVRVRGRGKPPEPVAFGWGSSGG